MSQDHRKLGEISTAFAPCSCGWEVWQVYADEGIRVCTQCSGQLAYIEEGIEDDELDRYRTAGGRLVHRKKAKHRIAVKHPSLPGETDCLAAVQWVLDTAITNLSRVHGYPHAAWASVTSRLWAAYVAALRRRLHYPLLQLFVNEPWSKNSSYRNGVPQSSATANESQGAENSGDATNESTAQVVSMDTNTTADANQNKAPAGNFISREARKRATQQAISMAATECVNSEEAPVLPPSMSLLLAVLLCSARVARLHLFVADLIRACREDAIPFFSAHISIQPVALRERLSKAHGQPLAFFTPLYVPQSHDILVLAERFHRMLMDPLSSGGTSAASVLLVGAGVPSINAPLALKTLGRSLGLPPEAAATALSFLQNHETATNDSSIDDNHDGLNVASSLGQQQAFLADASTITCEVELAALLVLGVRLCSGWERWTFTAAVNEKSRRMILPSSHAELPTLPRFALVEKACRSSGSSGSNIARYLQFVLQTNVASSSLGGEEDGMDHGPIRSGAWTDEVSQLEDLARAASDADERLVTSSEVQPTTSSRTPSSRAVPKDDSDTSLADAMVAIADGVTTPVATASLRKGSSAHEQQRSLVVYPLATAFHVRKRNRVYYRPWHVQLENKTTEPEVEEPLRVTNEPACVKDEHIFDRYTRGLGRPLKNRASALLHVYRATSIFDTVDATPSIQQAGYTVPEVAPTSGTTLANATQMHGAQEEASGSSRALGNNQRQPQKKTSRSKLSRFIGVYWDTSRGFWKVRIKHLIVGYYQTEIDAAKAHDDHVRPLGRRTNFPPPPGDVHTHTKEKWSRYQGLNWCSWKQMWCVRVWVGHQVRRMLSNVPQRKNLMTIGYFANEEEAARAYDHYAHALGYPLNFPVNPTDPTAAIPDESAVACSNTTAVDAMACGSDNEDDQNQDSYPGTAAVVVEDGVSASSSTVPGQAPSASPHLSSSTTSASAPSSSSSSNPWLRKSMFRDWASWTPHGVTHGRAFTLPAQFRLPFHAHYENLIEVVAERISCPPSLLHKVVQRYDRTLVQAKVPLVTCDGPAPPAHPLAQPPLKVPVADQSDSHSVVPIHPSTEVTEERPKKLARTLNEDGMRRTWYRIPNHVVSWLAASDCYRLKRGQRIDDIINRDDSESGEGGVDSQGEAAPTESEKNAFAVIRSTGLADAGVDSRANDAWAHLRAAGFEGCVVSYPDKKPPESATVTAQNNEFLWRCLLRAAVEILMEWSRVKSKKCSERRGVGSSRKRNTSGSSSCSSSSTSSSSTSSSSDSDGSSTSSSSSSDDSASDSNDATEGEDNAGITYDYSFPAASLGISLESRGRRCPPTLKTVSLTEASAPPAGHMMPIPGDFLVAVAGSQVTQGLKGAIAQISGIPARPLVLTFKRRCSPTSPFSKTLAILTSRALARVGFPLERLAERKERDAAKSVLLPLCKAWQNGAGGEGAGERVSACLAQRLELSGGIPPGTDVVRMLIDARSVAAADGKLLPRACAAALADELIQALAHCVGPTTQFPRSVVTGKLRFSSIRDGDVDSSSSDENGSGGSDDDDDCRVKRAASKHWKHLRACAAFARSTAQGSEEGRWMLETPPQVEVSASELQSAQLAAEVQKAERQGKYLGRQAHEGGGEGSSVISLRRFRRLAGVRRGNVISDDSLEGFVAMNVTRPFEDAETTSGAAASSMLLTDAARLVGWNGVDRSRLWESAAPALNDNFGHNYEFD